MTITPTNTPGDTVSEGEADHFKQAALTAIYDLADDCDIGYGLAVILAMDAVLADMYRAGDNLCRSYIDATLDGHAAAPGSDAENAAIAARVKIGPQLVQAMRAADEAEFQTTVFSGGAGTMQ